MTVSGLMLMAEWLDMLAWFFGCIAQTLPREGLVWQIAVEVAREEVAYVVLVAGCALVRGGLLCQSSFHWWGYSISMFIIVLPYYIWAWCWVPLCIQSAHQCSVWFTVLVGCWEWITCVLMVASLWFFDVMCCSGFNLSSTCVGCEVVPVVQCLSLECWCTSCALTGDGQCAGVNSTWCQYWTALVISGALNLVSIQVGTYSSNLVFGGKLKCYLLNAKGNLGRPSLGGGGGLQLNHVVVCAFIWL